MKKTSKFIIQSEESKIEITGEKFTMSFYDKEEIIQVMNNKDECVFIMKPIQPSYKEFVEGISK